MTSSMDLAISGYPASFQEEFKKQMQQQMQQQLTELNMYDKLERLENAVTFILDKLSLPALDTFYSKSANKPAKAPEMEVKVVEPVKAKEPELYRYEPLTTGQPEIRVLELASSKSDSDVLVGRIHNFDLLDDRRELLMPDPSDPDYIRKILDISAPRQGYNALSYTWGEPITDSIILVDGKSLPITRNLETALKQLRKGHETSNRWWIDQICINQLDIDERNSQVNLMRQIYKRAQTVTIWLGDPGDEESKRAMETIKQLLRRPIQRQPGDLIQHPQYSHFSSEEIAKNWSALQNMFQAPWWDRCWVRQEIALSTSLSIAYGSGKCDFNDTERVFQAFTYIKDIGFRPQQSTIFGRSTNFQSVAITLHDLRSDSSYGTEFMLLSDLLRHTRSCKATDPKDKVYSVLGLVDQVKYNLEVDYRLSFDEIMRNAFQSIISTENDEELHVLELCQNPERKHGLSSWAPNLLDSWKREPFGKRKHGCFLQGRREVSWEDHILLVQGIHWETVGLVCDVVVAEDTTFAELASVYNAWQSFVDQVGRDNCFTKSAKYYLNPLMTSEEHNASEWEYFLSVGVGSNIWAPQTAKEIDEYHESRAHLDIKAVRSCLVDPSFSFHRQENIQILELLYQHGRGRKIGLTKSGDIALFPDDVKTGDSIALIKGSHFPCVLRKDQGDDFVLVDEAWIPMIEEEIRISRFGLDRYQQTEIIRII